VAGPVLNKKGRPIRLATPLGQCHLVVDDNEDSAEFASVSPIPRTRYWLHTTLGEVLRGTRNIGQCLGLDQNLFDYLPFYIRKSEVSPAIAIGQLGVIEAAQMQNRGMQIVRMHRIFDRLESKVICGAVYHSAFDTATSEQHAETVAIVMPAILQSSRSAIDLYPRTPAELASDDHKGVLKHSTIFQIAQKRGNRLIGFLSKRTVPHDVSVTIPSTCKRRIPSRNSSATPDGKAVEDCAPFSSTICFSSTIHSLVRITAMFCQGQ
jgi:hypothetical protein